uniref:BY PROTMAP: gi/647400090/emb/CDR45195.1/ RHTO0S10e06590g1_1 [Rhodosporidium toruloides] n=1 Tax=Rhodotorula toruloides TaxID=5286 RepID=A0A0K3CEK3_RHOTO
MHATARKRQKLDRTAPSDGNLVEALSRLRAQAAFFAAPGTDAGELQREVSTLNQRIAAFEDALAQAEAGEVDRLIGRGWKDELDGTGTRLWNQSTALKLAQDDGQEQRAKLGVVASLRHAGYRLIRLGALEPLTTEARLSHLSLATKTASAFLDASQTSKADKLLVDAASLAADLDDEPAQDPTFLSERAKALLAHYCCRIRSANASGVDTIACWVREKARDLVHQGNLPRRETDKFARVAYEVGAAAINGEKGAAGQDSSSAIDWLQCALAILERDGQDEASRALQLATLKTLAQAYLIATPSPEHWEKAEETIKQALDLEPSASLARRLVKLVIARNGSDAEITQAFLAAVKVVSQNQEEIRRLVATLEALPTTKRPLRFQLLADAVEMLSSYTSNAVANSMLISQILLASFVQAQDADKRYLVKMLETLDKNMPAFRLDSNDAFTCMTYVWRHGDKAAQDRRSADAIDWFLLVQHAAFGSLETNLTSVIHRKAVVEMLTEKSSARAQKILQDPVLLEDVAKNHSLRFRAFLDEPSKALACLQAMTQSSDFSPKLLMWAHKIASEQGKQDLAAKILSMVGQVCSEGAVADGTDIDLMTLTRAIARKHIDALAKKSPDDQEATVHALVKQLEAGYDLARSLSAQNDSASLRKDLAWFYKTAFNHCVEHGAGWSSELATAVFAITAKLIEFDLELAKTSDPALEGKLVACRLATFRQRVVSARKAKGAKKNEEYRLLLAEVDKLIKQLERSPGSQPEKANDLLAAAYALKVEAHAELGEWSSLVSLVDAAESSSSRLPVSVVKLVVDKAASTTSTCPADSMSKILRKTLAILYSRREVEIAEMALWLRLIVSVLIHRNDRDQALAYVENAAHFIAQHQDDFPEDEANWMLATAWDEGLDLFASASPVAGEKWCSVGLKIARTLEGVGEGEEVESGLAKQMETNLAELKSRYGGSEVGGDGDVEMA